MLFCTVLSKNKISFTLPRNSSIYQHAQPMPTSYKTLNTTDDVTYITHILLYRCNDMESYFSHKFIII